MKIPNFASLYHSGTSYWRSDCQSARNGPCWIPVITCSKMAARSESYLLLARFQTWSIASGGSDAVGASESELARMTDEFEMKKPRNSSSPVGVHSEFGVSLGQSFFSSGLGNGASHSSRAPSAQK